MKIIDTGSSHRHTPQTHSVSIATETRILLLSTGMHWLHDDSIDQWRLLEHHNQLSNGFKTQLHALIPGQRIPSIWPSRSSRRLGEPLRSRSLRRQRRRHPSSLLAASSATHRTTYSFATAKHGLREFLVTSRNSSSSYYYSSGVLPFATLTLLGGCSPQ